MGGVDLVRGGQGVWDGVCTKGGRGVAVAERHFHAGYWQTIQRAKYEACNVCTRYFVHTLATVVHGGVPKWMARAKTRGSGTTGGERGTPRWLTRPRRGLAGGVPAMGGGAGAATAQATGPGTQKAGLANPPLLDPSTL